MLPQIQTQKVHIFHFLIIFVFLNLVIQVNSISFNFTSFQPNTTNILYHGDAFASSGIQVTKNQLDQSLKNSIGQALYSHPVRIWDKKTRKLTDFVTHFSFSMNALNSSMFGDGLSFFLKPFEREITMGSFGGYLGLFSPSTAFNSTNNTIVGVEFDTFKNPWDPSDNHVGINVNSIVSVVNVSWNSSIKDGRVANAWVSYKSSTRNLSVFLSYDEKPVFEGDSSLWYVVDLREVLPEWVYVGFSAATGDWIETHTVFSWDFSSNLEISRVKMEVWFVTAGLVAGLGGLSLVVGLFWFVYWRKRSINEDEAIEDDFEKGVGPKRYSFCELSKATNGFAEDGKLGEGGFGGVYKGVLGDVKTLVAVKRVSSGSKQGKKEYVSEVKIISRIRHRNLVQLIGWCHEQGDFLLVYEFMPNGSLDSHLFHGKSRLTWAVRYKIALGLSSALFYLHEEWEQCVVHRDIKSSNVMLDSSYNAKLGDFGLARLVDHDLGSQTTVLAGTMGYLAPECVMTGKASKESDVYSFGVVALEIACGRKPIDPKVEPSKQRLVEWVWALYGEGKLFEAVDEGLKGEFDETQMECLIVVGLWCCHPDSTSRPTIKQAIKVLNFEDPLPNLPSKQPVPMYYAPPMAMCRFTYTSSTGLTATTEQSRRQGSTSSCGSSMSAGSSKALLEMHKL